MLNHSENLSSLGTASSVDALLVNSGNVTFHFSLRHISDCRWKMMHDISSDSGSQNIVSATFKGLGQRYQKCLDDVTPYTVGRWIGAGVLTLFFLARVFILQGWYIVTYALGIYHLNLFIAFLSPKIDPALEFEDDAGPGLPTKANEEFRPFIRRLPEFKFWYSVMKSTTFATFFTFFDCFNVPVFWPILVLYFISLFCITMRRQIKHMFKYKYLPFTHGKPRYQGHEDSGKPAERLIPPEPPREG